MPETALDIDVERYEALVRKTALMIVEHPSGVEMEYDDICQRLRIKAWYALGKYDTGKDRVGVDRFVFACLQNEKKDILKKVRRNEAFIEDIAPGVASGEAAEASGVGRDRFEAHYLQLSPEDAFHDVEEQVPGLPSTLDRVEKQLVHFLYLDYDYGEIAALLKIPRKEVAPLVRGLRDKLPHWKPASPLTDSNGADAILPA